MLEKKGEIGYDGNQNPCMHIDKGDSAMGNIASENERLPARHGQAPRLAAALRLHWQLYVMLIIPIGFVIVFHYMVYPNLRIAFMDFRPAMSWDSPWVGFDTFRRIFADADFYRALRNTLMINVIDVFVQFPAPVILALMLNELRMRKFKRVSQTILHMPHFLSAVIVASVAYAMFRPQTGLANILLMEWGWIDTGIPFLTEPVNWVITYLTINIWQNMGWGTIIYLAAMTAIDPRLYEAATADGAGRLKQIWHVTLPGIKPVIVVLFIMRLGHILGGTFDRLNAFGNVSAREYQYQLPIYIYEKGLMAGRFSMATAVGLFQTLVALFMVLIADRIVKKLGDDGLI